MFDIISDPVGSLITELINCVAWMFLFKKCGLKWWQSFVPVLNNYYKGLCANRKKEGKIMAVLEAVMLILEIPILIGQINDSLPTPVLLICILVFIICYIMLVVYDIRITIGLCEIFGRSKKWLWLWIPFDSLIAVWWGLSGKFVPNRLATDKDKEAEFSGIEAEVTDNGLSVNIEQRAANTAFTKNILLKDIHMVIPAGRMVLLLGGSGAGKTTYLNAVTGYEKADAQIMLNGMNVYKDYDHIKYDLGFVPQQELMRGNDTVFKTLSDAANIRLPASMSRKDKEKRVIEVLESFGLAMLQNNMVEKLSGGQKKRLSIAIEFISDPSLFILDEPDSGLDGVVARSLFEKLREIADQGKIVLVITHTPNRVIDLFDDIIVLAKDSSRTGRLAFYGPVRSARKFFARGNMEAILRTINQKEEGGEGRADEFISKFSHVVRLMDEGKDMDEAIKIVVSSKYEEAKA